MKKILMLAVAAGLMTTTLTAAQAEPGGCVKYGAAGAVGGHVANHHGVLGAMGGCVTGMYVRHEHRKEARQKAALYDKDHPGAKGSYEEKATAYDVEHSTKPGQMTSDDKPAAPTGDATSSSPQ